MRRGAGEMAEWLKAHAWKACVRETVPWVRIPLSPPLSSCEPATRPPSGAFFFLSQRGLAAGSALRRLAARRISVSERPASLFERPACTVGRVQKVTLCQHLNKNLPRRSCRGDIRQAVDRRHPQAAWSRAAARASMQKTAEMGFPHLPQSLRVIHKRV